MSTSASAVSVYAAPLPAGHTHNEADIGIRVLLVTCIFTTLAGSMLLLRLYTRAMIVHQLGLDDFLMMLAFIFSVAMGVFCCLLENYGLGKHMWDVKLVQLTPYFIRNYLIAAILYTPAIACAKISILILYLRLSIQRNFSLGCYALIFVIAGYNTASVFANIFACTPFLSSWDLGIPSKHCIDLHAVYYTNNVLNIISDLAILLLPIPMVWQLQLPQQQKLGVLAIFMSGGVVCIISIIRLGTLPSTLRSSDTTWVTVEALIWCIIEVNISIIAGSSSSIKPFLRKHIPSMLGESTKGLDYSNKQRSRQNRQQSGNGAIPLHSLGGKHSSVTRLRPDLCSNEGAQASCFSSLERQASEGTYDPKDNAITLETTVIITDETRTNSFELHLPVAQHM